MCIKIGLNKECIKHFLGFRERAGELLLINTAAGKELLNANYWPIALINCPQADLAEWSPDEKRFSKTGFKPTLSLSLEYNFHCLFMSYNQTEPKTAKKTNWNINNNKNNFHYFLRKNGESKAKNQKWHLHAINTFCDVDQAGFKLPIMCSPMAWTGNSVKDVWVQKLITIWNWRLLPSVIT